MARIRRIEIDNFRCLQKLRWNPSGGINCLIGPGDAGKSSILDAIDFCIGARRVLQFTDADFHLLDVSKPIIITVTVGELDDSLKSLETYGSCLRGFTAKGTVEDEPEAHSETVLSVRLTVQGDLDPVWTLFSERAEAAGQPRFLTWSDRARIAPTRVGALADNNLAWRRGSILNRLSDELPDMTAALAEAARTARSTFGDVADSQLGGTLRLVEKTAKELGISLSDGIKATLDAHSVSFSGGTIALHGADGVPLRALGTGSTRLLLAGLQRQASAQSSILLIDELEHGLEPHRILRLLGSIGAKEEQPPIQAFITTHSPVTLRELRGDQLQVVRKLGEEHSVAIVGRDEAIQGTMRLYPEAFLAPTVVICEGASEAGLLRGFDLYLGDLKYKTLTASGIALVDAKGVSQIYARASAFKALGYRVAVLRDDDVQPNAAEEEAFKKAGGAVFNWRAGCALEDELFLALSCEVAGKLLQRAVALLDADAVDQHIRSASNGLHTLAQCSSAKTLDASLRRTLGAASRSRRDPWFKSVTRMESVARELVFPNWEAADEPFRATTKALYQWMVKGD
ncbi:hypothetical protein J2W99_004764 [Bosea robiniae]|uniref:ATP-dependent nuclease n=1 Tax=Bosea TaxID=85413 RepID=UPI002867429C|nr:MULTISPECIES: AAA family ATPase [Bosea]MDR6831012.1 hypothetical protein [Bosea robiniae]MDR6897387.1 hypothetical protein [Bosea sp. BE109]MDR7140784.1 hypothetical protein [Bosea sp. BE168]